MSKQNNSDFTDVTIVDARRETETDVSVVFDIGGTRQIGMFRRTFADSEIVMWNSVGEPDLFEFVLPYGPKATKQLGRVLQLTSLGKDAELPVVLYKNGNTKE